jgi:serine/threonine protein kinase/WD40 repeat protein
MQSSRKEKTTVETLAEEYLDRLRRGEHPTIAEYRQRFPELADEIGAFFPTLKLVENFGAKSHDGLAGPTAHHIIPPIKQLGDFQIIREIGRGGMGVVFQARQESLGRTVALKVLPKQILPDAHHQKRFMREAKAAARLHHTNIVPIFGVGHQDGLHYYVMQLIRGLGLDQVIVELQRRRKNRTDVVDVCSTCNSLPTSIVESLVTGQFMSGDVRESGESDDRQPDVGRDSMAPQSATSGTDADSSECQFSERRSEHALVESGSKPGTSYFRSVARIGIQTATALQYAHDQGVIHRDVKPANLLVDGQGTVWVTDFGLAKADDQDDLTRAGDIVGTIRYIAPEQFDGRGDGRSDIYSLGLTLYELLALRPAYDAEHRHQLVKQVTTMAPPPLGSIDAKIPADLQNIIHKSIERDPARRYLAAGELAADLQRFLDDRPIKARPISLVGHAVRWSRRKPAAAGLIALLMLLTIVSPLLALYFGHLVVETKQSHYRAQLALLDSRRSEASASRYSGRPGHHFDTLNALGQAARLQRELAIDDVSAIERMRGDATAALALADLKVADSWSIPKPSRPSAIHFDADLQYHTAWDGDALSVCRVGTGQEVVRLPVNRSCQKARFSPDGRFICVSSSPGEGDPVQVWDWRQRTLVYRVEKPAMQFATAFSPDSRQLAIGHDDGTVTLHDLSKREQAVEFQVASAPITLSFHPTEPLLAVNCSTAYSTQLWELDPLRLARTLEHPSDIFSLRWGPSGRLLAVVEGFDIHVWDTHSTSNQPMKILRGHTWVVSEMQFHPNGRMMLSHCWREGKTRVWDLLHGEQRFWQEGFTSRFSRDGTRHAFRDVDTVGLWDVSAGDVHVYPPTYEARSVAANFCDYSPDGAVLDSAGDQGIHLWDSDTWQLRKHLPINGTNSVRFDPRSSDLLVASRSGLDRYHIARSETDLVLGEVERIALPDGLFPHHLAQSSDGSTIIADLLQPPDLTPTGKLVMMTRGQSTPRIIQGEDHLRFTAVSPDGRWAASGNWHGEAVTIWDVQTGQQQRRLTSLTSSVVAFSPDGAMLVVADTTALRFFEVGTWRKLLELPRSALVGSLAFSADGRLLATTDNGSSVQLIDTSDFRTLATLTTNDDPTYVCWLAFRPDGNQLAVCRAKDGLRVWDLGRLREGLRKVDLHWQ